MTQVLADPSRIVPITPGIDAPAIGRIHQLAIVMSQDCDLDLDYKSRVGAIAQEKKIPAILFCEVEGEDALKASVPKGSVMWQWVSGNQHLRYHCLPAVKPEQDLQDEGLPGLGIDFKRYFSVPTEEIYARMNQDVARRCHLISPFREHLATRFAGYLTRVALPDGAV